MTLLWIAIGTVEICVLLFILAAAVLAMALRPGGKSVAETYLYAGELIAGEASEPALEIAVGDDYRAAVIRRGLAGAVAADGAVSLAVTVAGTDVIMEERTVAGRGMPPCAATPSEVIFYLDCLPPETRIHFRYNASASSRSASLSFTVRPGFRYTIPLTQ